MEGRQRNVRAPSFPKETREINKYGLLSLLTGIMPSEAPSPLGICLYYSDHLSQDGVWYGKNGKRHGLELAKPGFKRCHLLLPVTFITRLRRTYFFMYQQELLHKIVTKTK